MYEKIVNYFEANLCIENIYFRKYYKRWLIGTISVLIFELIINYILSIVINNLWTRSCQILIIDFAITIVALLIIYVLPMKKIYKQNVKVRTKFDLISSLMKEEGLSAYREVEIEKMEQFLRNECKVKKVDGINIIVDLINQEIENQYKKKNFIEKYFNAILPIVIFILTIYFTNNKEQQLTEIIAKTITSISSILIVIYIISKIKNMNITPVNKKKNLLELKRVLTDIMIKWSGR